MQYYFELCFENLNITISFFSLMEFYFSETVIIAALCFLLIMCESSRKRAATKVWRITKSKT